MIQFPLKWHGGKAYLAQRIVALMPPRTEWLHYVEPYFGGGAVLLANDPEGISEVANAVHGELVNFWRVLADPVSFEEFRRILEATPFSEYLWQSSRLLDLAGRMRSFTGVTRTRTRRGMNNEVSAWLTCIEGLPAVHARMKRVLILNRDALDVIQGQDGRQTLFYVDPPYLSETRTAREVYDHEMSRADHEELLSVLSGIQGRFLLSGYRSDLYDGIAQQQGWKRHDFDLPNNAAGGSEKRRMTECVWCNF